MRNKRKFYIYVLALLVLPFTACKDKYEQLAQDAPLISVGVRDGSGTYVRVRESPRRIIALDPTAVEMAFLLNRGDRIVAVSEFCDGPEEIFKLTTLLMEADSSYNIRTFAETEGDLIFHNLEWASPSPEAFRTFASNLGMPVFYRSHAQWESVLEDLHNIGKLLDNEKGARNFTEKLNRFAASISEKNPLPDTPKVVLLRSVEPMVVVGAGHYTNGLLKKMGARNALDFIPKDFADGTPDLITGQKPDFIFVLTEDEFRASDRLSEVAPSLAETPAGKNSHIIAVPPKAFLRPGPELLNAVAILGQHLYPKADLDALYKAVFSDNTPEEGQKNNQQEGPAKTGKSPK